jgi:hypothetical protein
MNEIRKQDLELIKITKSEDDKCNTMISLEKCKKYLNGNSYANEEIEEIRSSLYQVAELLIDKFIEGKNYENRKIIEN